MKRQRSKRLTLNSCHYDTVERLAMAMMWQQLPANERDFARTRARNLIDAIAMVMPSNSKGRQ